MTRPPAYVHGALVSGWSAYAILKILRAQWSDQVEDLPLHLRAPLEDVREALEYEARRWQAARNVSATGSSEAALPEAAPDSEHQELTSAEVANVLHLTDRRVRQLAGAGALAARQVAGRWVFDPGAVTAYRECKERQ